MRTYGEMLAELNKAKANSARKQELLTELKDYEIVASRQCWGKGAAKAARYLANLSRAA